MAMIEYTNWEKKPKVWNTDNQLFFLLISEKVVGNNGAYFSHSASFYARTAGGVYVEFAKWMRRHSDFQGNWFDSAVNAKIVQAPCAFDARETHILVESLNPVKLEAAKTDVAHLPEWKLVIM